MALQNRQTEPYYIVQMSQIFRINPRELDADGLTMATNDSTLYINLQSLQGAVYQDFYFTFSPDRQIFSEFQQAAANAEVGDLIDRISGSRNGKYRRHIKEYAAGASFLFRHNTSLPDFNQQEYPMTVNDAKTLPS
jgi:hypothetical protein